MIAWFIIALATLAVFAFIAINGVQTVASTTDSVGRTETVRRLENASSALIARAVALPGDTASYLPAGQTINGIYTLPQDLASLSVTPFGQRIAYCPFGGITASGGTAGTVRSQDGNTYNVQIQTVNGRDIVTAGRPAFPQVAENPNLMGFLIAPRTKTGDTPSCDQVRYNGTTKRFEVADGIVRPIIREAGSDESRTQVGREIVYFVSQTGTGRGLSASDPASFQTALDYYRTRTPAAMRIEVADGSYILPTKALDVASGQVANKGTLGTLVIESTTGNVQIAQAGSGDINVPSNLDIRNITFDSGTSLIVQGGRQTSLTNVTIGQITVADGSSLSLNGAWVAGGPNGYALTIASNSRVSLAGTVTFVAGAATKSGVLVDGGSQLTGTSTTINLRSAAGTAQIGMQINENSQMTLRSSTVNIVTQTGVPLLVRGRVALWDSLIAPNYNGGDQLIRLGGGGELAANGGTIGAINPTARAIVDVGGAKVSGNAAVRTSGGYCWKSITDSGETGSLFSMSPDGNVGANSAVTADVATTPPSDPVTAAALATYTQQVSDNARRRSLRAVNTSAFSCTN